MKKNTIDLFFTELDRRLQRPAEVILTGAAAGALMGHVRPSLDIDFEIRLEGRRVRNRDSSLLETAIQETSKKTGLAVNYSKDISRWSMIEYLDYREKARLYKVIGKISVKVMSPEHWTLGKMGRFLEIDIRDLLKVIKKKKLRSRRLVALWANALRSSILSIEKGRFRDHVFYFLTTHGKKLWGRDFDPERAIRHFKRAAGL